MSFFCFFMGVGRGSLPWGLDQLHMSYRLHTHTPNQTHKSTNIWKKIE